MRTPPPGRDASIGSSGIPRCWRHLCAIALLPLVASCRSWLPVPGAGLSPAQSERMDHARVHLRDGTLLDLRAVTITPDSIVGRGGTTASRLAVARSDVEEVDTRSEDPLGNFLAGALAVVVGLFLTFRTAD
jgi:hypothetical protein